MTKDKYRLASLNAPEANYPSSTPTPTINTPSTSTSPHSSRRASPYRISVASKARVSPPPRSPSAVLGTSPAQRGLVDQTGDSDLEDEDDMGDSRPPLHRPTDGRSQVPLLKDERGRPSYEASNGNGRPTFATRRSTFRSRSPEMEGSSAVRKKYTYAGFFLLLSLVSFVIQTETAVYIQHQLGWKKAYAML